MLRGIRRYLVVLACAALLVAVLAPSASAAKKPVKADTVYVNGNIYTVDKKFSRAHAMAIKGDRFLAVGEYRDVARFIGRDTNVINLRARTVLPGLIESHLHYSGVGSLKQQIDVFWLPKAEILNMVAAAYAKAGSGEWIKGRGWNQAVWTPAVFPTAADLDAVALNNPVVLGRVDGHAIWCNSKAMELAGITDSTPNPAGGEIIRDENGHATGVFIDNAKALVNSKIPAPSARQQIEALTMANDELLTYGFTSVVDQGAVDPQIDQMKALYASGTIKLRVYQQLRVQSPAEIPAKYFDQPKSERVGLFDDRYTINGIKMSMDGTLGSRGAWMLADYTDRANWTGLVRVTPEDAFTIAKEARLHGFQVTTHCIGDRANRETLNVYEKLNTELPKLSKDPRYRIEHAQVVALEDIPRFKQIGAIPSMQSVHATSDKNMAELRVGPERIKGAYAWRKFLNTGVVLPNGSDASVELVNPYHGLYAAVTRMDRDGNPAGGWYPDECMTRKEALRSFTIWGAYAQFSEKLKGSIEKNKLADFVIVSGDYMKCPAAELKNMTARMTVIGGEIVYTAPGFKLIR